MPEPQIENRYPGCVAMKLHLKPYGDEALPSMLARFRRAPAATCADMFRISLTITFGGQQEIDIPRGQRLGLPGGRATFGIRRGQLKLALQNCTMPLEKVELADDFQVSETVERQTSRSAKVQGTLALDKRSIGTESTEGRTEKRLEKVFQVKKTGSESFPAWTFEADEAHNLLEGTLREQLLGLLSVALPSYEINAVFTVRGEDIQITWGQIGGTENIHRNKLAIIERGIVLRYLRPLIQDSPICEWRESYG